MIMIPTDRPVRSVERKRLTICLRIPPLSTPPRGGVRGGAMPQAFHQRVDHDESGYYRASDRRLFLAMMLVGQPRSCQRRSHIWSSTSNQGIMCKRMRPGTCLSPSTTEHVPGRNRVVPGRLESPATPGNRADGDRRQERAGDAAPPPRSGARARGSSPAPARLLRACGAARPPDRSADR